MSGDRRARILLGVSAAVAALICPATSWARRTGIETTSCSGCHSGGNTPVVTLSASPENPMVGQTVTLTVTITQTNGPVAGFYLTSVNPLLLNVDPVGTFVAMEAGTAADSGGVTHTMPRTGSGGITTFKASWSTKSVTGVTFLVNGMSANGNNMPSGDAPGSASLSLTVGCVGASYYVDQDGDGYGTSDPGFLVSKACTQPAGYAPVPGDCNDFAPAIHPGAPEMCDGKDNNCDGAVDEAVVYQMYCEDKDGDGHGLPTGAMKSDCAPSKGFGDCGGDCNDFDANVHPGGTEICDGHDNDCNGMVDEGVRQTCGTGWCRRYAQGCTTTCTPGAPMAETCNNFDDDCDGVMDNGTDVQLCGGPGLVCRQGFCVPASSSGSGGAVGSDAGTAGRPGAAAGTGGETPAQQGSGGGCSLGPDDPLIPRAPGIAIPLGAAWLLLSQRRAARPRKRATPTSRFIDR